MKTVIFFPYNCIWASPTYSNSMIFGSEKGCWKGRKLLPQFLISAPVLPILGQYCPILRNLRPKLHNNAPNLEK